MAKCPGFPHLKQTRCLFDEDGVVRCCCFRLEVRGVDGCGGTSSWGGIVVADSIQDVLS